MHDKADTYLSAVALNDLLSFLCDWHGIEAFGRKLLSLASLSIFSSVITLAFKAALLSVDLKELTDRYAGFISLLDKISASGLVKPEQVEAFKVYIKEEWFGDGCGWKEPAIKARLLLAPEEVRQSPSANTNNQTERAFLALMQDIMFNRIAKSACRFMVAIHQQALTMGALLVSHDGVLPVALAMMVFRHRTEPQGLNRMSTRSFSKSAG